MPVERRRGRRLRRPAEPLSAESGQEVRVSQWPGRGPRDTEIVDSPNRGTRRAESRHSPVPVTAASAFRERILSLECPRNWDGEGASPITRSTCEAGILFLEAVYTKQLPDPTFISRTFDGAIGFQWNIGSALIAIRIASLRANGCVFQTAGSIGRKKYPCDFSRALRELGGLTANI